MVFARKHITPKGDGEVVGRIAKFVTYPNGTSQQTNLPDLQ